MADFSFQFLNEELHLLPEKAIYWPKENLLIIADIHLGKASHFRNNGIAIPASSADTDLINLALLLERIEPKKVLFLGDLFHSSYNLEWQRFTQLLNQFSAIDFILIVGNHDILEAKHYEASRLTNVDSLTVGPFLFTHEPIEIKQEKYNLSGHIHPGVELKGKGKLKAKVPCFYFGKQGGILPAFGRLTGLYALKPKKSDQFFGIVGKNVIAL